MIKTFYLTPMIRVRPRQSNPESVKLSFVDRYRKTPKKIEASSVYTYDIASAKRAFRPRFPSWFGIAAISRRYAHARARVCAARALRSCAYTCACVWDNEGEHTSSWAECTQALRHAPERATWPPPWQCVDPKVARYHHHHRHYH